MMTLLVIIYLVLGVIAILSDSLTVQTEAKAVFTNNFTFMLATLLWPLVVIWAKYKWNQRLKG